MKSLTPQESLVYLIDTQEHRYYYPTSTDLRGEVLPGHPRVGLIAFEPLQEHAGNFEIHFSSVKLSKERGKRETFRFQVREGDLRESIASALKKPTAYQAMTDQIDEAITEQQNKVAETMKAQNSGCAVALAYLIGMTTLAGLSLGVWFGY